MKFWFIAARPSLRRRDGVASAGTGLPAQIPALKIWEGHMHNRKNLEADPEIMAELSCWGAQSLSALSAFIVEKMYKAEAIKCMDSFKELKKHVEYFENKAGVKLTSIIDGIDFEVEKAILLDFSKNCFVAAKGVDGLNKSIVSIKTDLNGVRSALARIQTQLLINSWIVGSADDDQDRLRKRIIGIGSLLSPMAVTGVSKIRIGSQTDGGYVMLDDFVGVDGALSFGINDEDSWDVDIANRGLLFISTITQ
ncbi:hypothetical protein ACVDG8_009075 [Mesorhizobium sp. ORM8.1]